jgi:hypothetical protein
VFFPGKNQTTYLLLNNIWCFIKARINYPTFDEKTFGVFFPLPPPMQESTPLEKKEVVYFFGQESNYLPWETIGVSFPGKKQLGTLDEKRCGVVIWAQNNYPSVRNTRCFFFFFGQGKNQTILMKNIGCYFWIRLNYTYHV